MKPFHFSELSDMRCSCGKRLKKNLIAKKPHADMCFKCWYALETHRKGGHGQGRQIKNF